MVKMNKEDLIKFEKEISELFLAKKIHVPVHLVGGNESKLINIFKQIKKEDFVFSTHRNHFHALLKGIPKEKLKQIITDGESMHIYDKNLRFFTSSIVGGILPIAVGVAMGIKMKGKDRRVYAFCGDMSAEMGIFHECTKYAERQKLPIDFIIEDNGLSVNTPTQDTWGSNRYTGKNILRYSYVRTWPHVGCGKWITF